MDFEALAGKRIALGVCGGIAAYKAAALARELTQAGADVRVVMTNSATKFVGPITFSTLTGNPVRTSLFPETAPSEIVHTDLGRTSDLVIVAPATAKIIAKSAQGISDDLMSAMLLSAACPVLMAPAMHSEMWLNEATQENVAKLTSRGIRFVGPEEGPLAGPDSGIGRLAEISSIVRAAAEELQLRGQLAGTKVVVTAGGTREAIDAVRYIANASSGLMGYELAYEALRRGASVTLISGPTDLVPPSDAHVMRVTTASEMRTAVMESLNEAAVLIMAAAVADWRPVSPSRRKLSKSDGCPQIELEPTADILAEVGERRSRGDLPDLRVLVGFAAETDNLQGAAAAKLEAKHLDLVVANLVATGHSGPGAVTSDALMLDREGNVEHFGLIPKRQVAYLAMERIAGRLLAGMHGPWPVQRSGSLPGTVSQAQRPIIGPSQG
jgi:phosphopantothenoylcysteine decarboxylase/phosphopantothenate--cysteine ligase